MVRRDFFPIGPHGDRYAPLGTTSTRRTIYLVLLGDQRREDGNRGQEQPGDQQERPDKFIGDEVDVPPLNGHFEAMASEPAKEHADNSRDAEQREHPVRRAEPDGQCYDRGRGKHPADRKLKARACHRTILDRGPTRRNLRGRYCPETPP
jgi:hypothetical protein